MFALTTRNGALNPLNGFFGFNGRHNRLLDLFEGRENDVAAFRANTAVREDENVYNITAELPGIEKKDVKVEMDNNILTITAERKKPEEKEGENLHYDELQYGKYTRRFTVPKDVLPDKIEAAFKDGLLTVTVPKAEKKQPREIKVK
jgi:HSP20 family protein